MKSLYNVFLISKLGVTVNRVEFTSRARALDLIQQGLFDQGDWNLISISDSCREKRQMRAAWLARNPDSHGHFVNFADVDDLSGGLTPAKCSAIIRFIGASALAQRNILVHCHLGVSRSAGVAKWCQDFHGYQNIGLERYTLYNKFVYSQLMDAFQGLTD